MSIPEVSVVMSVFNGARSLEATLESVLTQEGCELEFIVVDDGSHDETGRILNDRAARDPRLHMIRLVRNEGLTNALVRGCAEARGQFIARQDCGDVSLPRRMAAQAAVLRAEPQVMMVACGTRFVGPRGERLYVATLSGEDLNRGLLASDWRKLVGPPHHGGTMFRRTAYEAAGGYRPAFVVAQDIDLWMRLAERGRCVNMSSVGYEAKLEPGSISARRRREQIEFAGLAIECAKCRREGRGDDHLLESFVRQGARGGTRGATTAQERARFFYFVGSCLRESDTSAARRYFRMAAREDPFHLKALWRTMVG